MKNKEQNNYPNDRKITEKNKIKKVYINGAGDGNRTREGTNPLGPQPSAFDRSTTPA